MIKILEVESESVAQELGIVAGDYVVKINGKEPKDMLDMIYFDSLKRVRLEIMDSQGFLTKYNIKKGEDEKLGISLEGFDDIKTKWCANKCVFCFVDQLPKGLRKTLYIKDDDWRLSFATGSYVTLTNVNKQEIKRICKQKFSPLYISVHATDQKMRLHLLGRKTAEPIMKVLKKFARSGITIHTQAVVCPGLNDGEILEKTIKDLMKLYPQVKSLAVVPVGLSCHRHDLCKITPFDKDSANKVLDICNKWRAICKSKFGEDFVYPSDELYLKAEREFPAYEEYGEFDQIENGIGLVPKLEREFMDALDTEELKKDNISYTIITGVSATDLMKKLTNEFMKRHNNVKIEVVTIINNFFGPTVTVAGLTVGKDIIEQTKNVKLGDYCVIPKVMMKETENVFLDGTTLEELQQKLGRPVLVSGYLGSDLVKILCGGEK